MKFANAPVMRGLACNLTYTVRMATFPRIFLIFCLLRVIYAWGVPIHANILTGNDEIGGSYDYVIVGGGTAGLTVGDRLSADGKCTSFQSKRFILSC